VWGLANRVYGLLNALAYAARFHRPLHVDWTDGMYAEKGMNAFPGIFSLRGVESLDAMPRLERPFPDICRGRLDEDCRTTWAPRTESIFDGFPDFDHWHLVPRGVYDGYVYCSRPSYGRPFALAARLPWRARTVYGRHVTFSESMQRQLDKVGSATSCAGCDRSRRPWSGWGPIGTAGISSRMIWKASWAVFPRG